jgi:transcriptional regulator with XRE-family HTH domain
VNYSSFGKSLRKARKKLGMSQFDVAHRMGCSRAQVDNIEVARQRAPLYRLEDFAKAVGIRVMVQLIPRGSKSVTVRTTGEMTALLEHMSNIEEVDRELLFELAALMPHLPQGIRGTLRGIITLWTERYSGELGREIETA